MYVVHSIGLTCMYLPVSPLTSSMISANITKLRTNSIYGDIYIFLNPSSLYSIDISDVLCYEYTRVLFVSTTGSNYTPSCQYPNINLLINSIVIILTVTFMMN